MKRNLILFLGLFYITSVEGQLTKRLKNETEQKFIERVTNVTKFSYPIFSTNKWNSNKETIFAFLNTPDEITIGFMFIKINKLVYKQILIDSFSTFGNTAKIDTVFFVNADKDKQKELVVMSKYDHNNNGKSIKIYWNLIFDNFYTMPKRLKYLKNISAKIDDGFNGSFDKEKNYGKFKNAREVKLELKKLGY